MKTIAVVAFPLFSILGLYAYGQQNHQIKRLAIYPFQDNISNRQLIGQKLYDKLVSRITDSGTYQVVDRQFLDKIVTEQQLPKGLFDDATAVRLGKLMNVSVVLVGTISTVNVNQNAGDDPSAWYGAVTIEATGRLISTETGAIIKAPTASNTARGPLRQKPAQAAPPPKCVTILGNRVCAPPSAAPSAPHVDLVTLDQLADRAVDAVGAQLTAEIVAVSGSAISSAPSLAPISVIGLVDGQTYIDKGTGAGLKVGQTLQVFRTVNTGLTNPSDGSPVTRKNQICVLTLTDVEEKNASGACSGGSPSSGDSVEMRAQ